MKTFYLLVFYSLVNYPLYGQLTDDFSDGDFLNDPSWYGHTEKFVTNDALELQLYDTSFNSPAWLSLPCNIAENAFWSFDIRMPFNPSSSNYIDIYLISNHENPLEASTAYYLRIGDTQDDISLYKTVDNNTIKLIDGIDDFTDQNTQELHIEIQYTDTQWELSSKNGNNENETLFAIDALNEGNQYFSLLCHYTTTRKDKFFIDNIFISGDPYIDTSRPKVYQFHIESPSSLFIEFSEALELSSVTNTTNYRINNSSYPTAISPYTPNENAYILHFEESFPFNELQQIHIENIADLAGNFIQNWDSTFYYMHAFSRDIVFSEIMADPNPPVLLEEVEYLEIYNRANYPLNLDSFQLCIDDKIKWIPDSILAPHSFAIFCHSNNIDRFPETSLCIPIATFSIKNDAAHIVLKSKKSVLIDDYFYTNNAYTDQNKANGGWSLEKIDLDIFCDDLDNWNASTHYTGGTPGYTNSINTKLTDIEKPYINSVIAISEYELQITFNERLNKSFQVEDFDINFHIGQPHSLDSISNTTLLLHFEQPFQIQTLYELSIEGTLEDCNGNKKNIFPLLFMLPENIEKDDIIINELLFNPYPNGVDFVEIYNRSNKVLDLSGIRIARYEHEELDQLSIISEKHAILFPGEYRVLCTDSTKVFDFYNCNKKNFIEMSSFPSLPDDTGGIAICYPWLEIIDSLAYNKNMHFSHLNDLEGVSLERLSTVVSGNNKDNWHSASYAVGFASPAFVNSQHKKIDTEKATIEIFPKIISPNNDGYQDYLTIHYCLDGNQYSANIHIYNRFGQLIRQISKHLFIGAQGLFRWDGNNESGQLVNNGIYIVVFEYINLEGKHFIERSTCIVRSE
jgi:gliding motility-associated-like protein